MYGLARFGAFWRTEATVSDTKKRPEKSRFVLDMGPKVPIIVGE